MEAGTKINSQYYWWGFWQVTTRHPYKMRPLQDYSGLNAAARLTQNCIIGLSALCNLRENRRKRQRYRTERVAIKQSRSKCSEPYSVWTLGKHFRRRFITADTSRTKSAIVTAWQQALQFYNLQALLDRMTSSSWKCNSVMADTSNSFVKDI